MADAARKANRNRRRAHLRKRKPTGDDDDEGGEVNVVVSGREEKEAAVNTFTSARSAKGPTSSSTFEYGSSGLAQRRTDMGATKLLETETEFDRDGRAQREKVLRTSTQEGGEDAAGGDGKYKGLLGYNDYKSGFRREQNASNMRKTGAFGPLRASTAIRTTFRMDYQPDICKDYKETGFCGYGDSCKFLHDRGDYKSGWQLEREWEEKEKLRREQKCVEIMTGGAEKDEDEKEDDGLPFACHICRLPFKSPVVTRCKHYFCEHCALKEHARTGKCAICNQATNGTFNVASNLVLKMKRLEEESKAEERKSEDPGREDALPPPPSPPREGEALQVEEIDEGGFVPPPPPSGVPVGL